MKTSCIYRYTNVINNDFYIGSAKDFAHRKRTHLYGLRHNKHPNIHLQHAYNRDGEANFEFDIVEIVLDISTLVEREQYYIDTLHPPYNLLPTAGSRFGHRHSEASKEQMRQSALKRKVHGHTGHSHSEETKQLLREQRIGQEINENQRRGLLSQKGQPRSKEHARKIADSGRGKHNRSGWHHTEATKLKLSQHFIGYDFGPDHGEKTANGRKKNKKE